jgi:hypothetical protein
MLNKKLLTLALLASSVAALGADIPKGRNRTTDGDISWTVNDGGVVKEVIKVEGTTGAVTLGASGETAEHSINGAVQQNALVPVYAVRDSSGGRTTNEVLGAFVFESSDASNGAAEVGRLEAYCTSSTCGSAGLKFWTNQTAAMMLAGTVDSGGSWTLGPSASVTVSNTNGGIHKVVGNLVSGVVTSTNASGEFGISTNLRWGSGPAQSSRTDSVTGGAGISFVNSTTDAGGGITFAMNQTGDATSANSNVVGQITHAGVWIIGAPGLNADHQMYGDTFAITSNSASTNTSITNLNTGTHTTSTSLLRLGFAIANATPGNYIRFNDSDTTTTGAIRADSGTTVQYLTSSDARLKTDIADLPDGLATVVSMHPVRYKMIGDPVQEHRGFLAQELQTVYPFAVSGNPDGDVAEAPMMVDYSKLTPVLAQAIKELNDKHEALKAEFDAYKLAHP